MINLSIQAESFALFDILIKIKDAIGTFKKRCLYHGDRGP